MHLLIPISSADRFVKDKVDFARAKLPEFEKRWTLHNVLNMDNEEVEGNSDSGDDENKDVKMEIDGQAENNEDGQIENNTDNSNSKKQVEGQGLLFTGKIQQQQLDDGSISTASATELDFDELVLLCTIMTMNAMDLYFQYPRDPRRGIFLAHKLLLNLQTESKCDLFSNEIQQALTRYCYPGQQLTAGQASSSSSSSSRLPAKLESLEGEVNEAPNHCVYIHPNLKKGVQENSGTGLYLEPQNEIKANEDVARIGEDAMINIFQAYEDVDFRPLWALLQDGQYQRDEESISLVFLVFCKVFGKKKFILDHLPELDDMHNLLNWPNEALENLYCPQVIHQVHIQKLEMQELFDQLQAIGKESAQSTLMQDCTMINANNDGSKSKQGQEGETTGNDNSMEVEGDNNNINIDEQAAKIKLTQSLTEFLTQMDFDDLLWARCIFDSRAFNVEMVVGEKEVQIFDQDQNSNKENSNEVAADQQITVVSNPAPSDSSEEEGGQDNEGNNVDLTNAKEGQRVKFKQVVNQQQQEEDSFFIPHLHITCLVPTADYLNHSSQSTLMVPRYEASKKAFILQSATDIKSNQEVYLNYGPLQNWELLLYYGFCFDRNQYDTLQMEIGEPDDEKQLEMLQEMGIPTDHVLQNVGSITINEGSQSQSQSNSNSDHNEQSQQLLTTLEKKFQNLQVVGNESNINSSKEKENNMQSEKQETRHISNSTQWPLSKKLLIHLRILHGLTEQIEDFDATQIHVGNQHDVEICDTLLEVFQQMLVPTEGELEQQIMTPEAKMWEMHKTYGPLARSFRDSQRRMVQSNIDAVEGYKERFSAVVAEYMASQQKSSRNGGGPSSKRRRRGARK